MELLNGILYVVALIISVVIHEVAHGYAAEAAGDPTARLAGRLTLNPLKHLDLVGSVLLPLFLVIFQAGFMIGWAKPVPYNPANLRHLRRGTIQVAAAGIVANLILAAVFGLLLRFSAPLGITAAGAHEAMVAIVVVNLVLALFNLTPIPPLDGSKILFALLPARAYTFIRTIESWSLPLLLVYIFFLWQWIVPPVVSTLFVLLTGAPF